MSIPTVERQFIADGVVERLSKGSTPVRLQLKRFVFVPVNAVSEP